MVYCAGSSFIAFLRDRSSTSSPPLPKVAGEVAESRHSSASVSPTVVPPEKASLCVVLVDISSQCTIAGPLVDVPAI